MENRIIERVVEIAAPIKKVWSVFIDPDITQRMGGYYDTTWKVGGSFGFKKVDGTGLTNGVLLALEPQRLIKHSLFLPTSDKMIATITYHFEVKDRFTLLKGEEVLVEPLGKGDFDDACAGWEFALNQVKKIAESS